MKRLLLPLLFLGTLAGHARAGWPPAPGADMRDKSNWPNDYQARWSYLSYFDRAANAPALEALDNQLGASGMSIDKAWTLTTGVPETRIAVVDTGIQWASPDLLSRAALNRNELKGDARPRTKDDKVCETYDCNGDGVFNVADYADDPRITPIVQGEACSVDGIAKGDRIKGDLNRNCVLDPGDLILLFSDGIDDDANGYVDDICGWDFFKNDNDPFDDTLNGHGTQAAHESVAEANNGAGEPGVCPSCSFIPLRVGDELLTDANDIAKAIIYAADNEAKVVQSALVSINQTAFSKAALDYARRKGSLVIASMGEDNARQHAMPATANHVLAVRGLRPNNDDPKSASTFVVANDPCSGFGAQLTVGISASNCASEAVSRAAGIAGLVHSYARQQNLTLSTDETFQLFTSVASPGPQPFDQRFGHGRANAMRMLELVREATIPPEVDLVGPDWFTPVFASAPIPIMGRVAASRATAYDLTIQWAPGVQPADADFKDIVAPLTNIPAGTVSGGTSPLAQLDPTQVDTKHLADPDSPRGENARSLTIRVRAIAHYPTGDVRGEARRVIAITNARTGSNDDLVPGFPLALGASIEASPKLADINGDGVRDIVVGDSAGKLHVWSLQSGTPTEIAGFPYLTRPIDGLNQNLGSEPTVPSYAAAPGYVEGVDRTLARESIVQAPAIADIDGDGTDEIIFTTWPGTIYVVNARGQDLPGWPKRLPLVPSCAYVPKTGERCMDAQHHWARGTFSAPVVADLDRDGKLEILVGGFDGRLWAFKADATSLSGFPIEISTSTRITSTPAIADFDDDKLPTIIVGAGRTVHPLGLAGWPITVDTAPLPSLPIVSEGTAQVVADFDGDGHPEIVVQPNGSAPTLFKMDPNQRSILEQTAFVPIAAQPSVGDIDQDGIPDVVSTGASPDRTRAAIGIWSGRSGTMVPGSPIQIEGPAHLAGAAIADVSGDEYPEVIAGSGSYFVHAVDGCGREATGFPKLTNGWVASTPAVGDIDGDAQKGIEVVAATREGYLFAWKTKGRRAGVIQWESFRHDNANTGNYSTRLDQGTRTRALAPLTCPVTPTAEAPYELGGGCACKLGTTSPVQAGWAPGLLGLSVLLLRRRTSRARQLRRCTSHR